MQLISHAKDWQTGREVREGEIHYYCWLNIGILTVSYCGRQAKDGICYSLQFVSVYFNAIWSTGALSTFQQMMDFLIRGMKGYLPACSDEGMKGYLSAKSGSVKLQLKSTQTIWEFPRRLLRANLTVKPSKWQFAKFECTHLSHIVGKGVSETWTVKDRGINMSVPKTKKEAQQIGLASYYWQFIRNFITIATPQKDLMQKLAPLEVQRSAQTQNFFDTIQSKVGSSPVLLCPNSFILQKDVSDYGTRAVLIKMDNNKDEHLMAFSSKLVISTEQRYSTIEKECLHNPHGCSGLSGMKKKHQ